MPFKQQVTIRRSSDNYGLVLGLCLAFIAPVAADPSAISGSWSLDVDASGTVRAEINQLKRDHRDYTNAHSKIGDPNKPDPFASRRTNKEWDSRPGGPVANASITVRQMVAAESLKLYVSERIIIAYDRKLKRLISPNPNGRVHSATGKGVSSDAVGETLAYFDGDAIVIETRTKIAERLVERFELTPSDQLKVTINLKNPQWRRKIEFVRFFNRNTQ
ncbi:MAG: hypothetical protein E2O36_08215 [Proteobacteria bacterium]|nr:MAG: hypothetical protein E2O36_08215 [Pseudomonadota bacterium]